MISVSGVRGVVGDTITPEIVTAYAAAFGVYCHGGKVLLGRDTRTTGELLHHAALAGLLSVGCEVLDVGIAPTPTIQLAVETQEAAGGIAITASHNPAEWNALKFFGPDGLFLSEEQMAAFFALKDRAQLPFVRWDKVGKITPYPSAVEEHLVAVLNCPLFDVAAIRKANFRVAVDTVCGAGGKLLPDLLEELGCQVVKIHSELTGIFPHNPEPLPDNLADLCQLVRTENCQVGFATDPDADRLAIVDETGAPIGEENTLVLATRLVLSRQRGPIVTNVSTTRALDDLARQHGVPLHRTKVGESHVVKKMKDVDAIIGGEGNGGVIYPEIHLARDSAVGVMMTLQSLVEAQSTLSALIHSLPHYVITKRKMPIGDLPPEELLKRLATAFSRDEQDHTDGLKVIKPMSWFQLRPSNTEPILRLYAEGVDQTQADQLADQAMQEVQKIIASSAGAS